MGCLVQKRKKKKKNEVSLTNDWWIFKVFIKKMPSNCKNRFKRQVIKQTLVSEQEYSGPHGSQTKTLLSVLSNAFSFRETGRIL